MKVEGNEKHILILISLINLIAIELLYSYTYTYSNTYICKLNIDRVSNNSAVALSIPSIGD